LYEEMELDKSSNGGMYFEGGREAAAAWGKKLFLLDEMA
jgi:hypothetical protein